MLRLATKPVADPETVLDPCQDRFLLGAPGIRRDTRSRSRSSSHWFVVFAPSIVVLRYECEPLTRLVRHLALKHRHVTVGVGVHLDAGGGGVDPNFAPG